MSSSPSIAVFAVHGEGVGVHQRVTVKGGKHTFETDAAPVFGGSDRFPSPLYYLLGSLISCSQVTAQLAAKSLNITLKRFEFDVSGDLDTRILVKGEQDGNANFEKITLKAEVETDADDETLQLLKEETERRCPVFQLFKQSGVKIEASWGRRQTWRQEVLDTAA